jgi:hypothetical protein
VEFETQCPVLDWLAWIRGQVYTFHKKSNGDDEKLKQESSQRSALLPLPAGSGHWVENGEFNGLTVVSSRGVDP